MTAVAEPHARGRQESRFTDEPQCRTGRDPIVGQIHGIAVAGENLETRLERLVHLFDVMLVELVVGIEHEERIVRVGCTGIVHLIEQIRQRVAFAHKLLVEAFDHMAAHIARHFGGIVGAIVGDKPNVDQFGRVGLRLDAGNEVADDVRLVSCGNQHRVTLVHRRVGKFDRLGEQGDENAHRLIDHPCATDDDQQNVKYAQQYH